jgi:hypothetical protein
MHNSQTVPPTKDDDRHFETDPNQVVGSSGPSGNEQQWWHANMKNRNDIYKVAQAAARK